MSAGSPAPGVSVVICCYNSTPRLPETLKHLLAQDAPADLPWEVIVVDNTSTDDTARIARSLWPDDAPVPLRVVSEPEPGLSHARKRGLSEARYELISFVDDDNWLAADWVRLVAEIMAAHPEVGACGGRTEAVTETPPPAWFAEHAASYVVGRQGDQVGDVTWSRGHLWGAGLTLRKQAWMDLVSKGFVFQLSDRKGKKLSSGGDYEICYALRLAGWRLWYCDKLMLRHFIPAERLTADYLSRLKIGFGTQTIGHDPYRFYVWYQPSEVKTLFGRLWLRQALREIYIALFRDGSFWRSRFGRSAESSSHRMRWLFHRGRLAALWGARSNYDFQVTTFDQHPWIRIERQTANYLHRNPDFGDAGNPELSMIPLVSVLICNYNYGRYLAEAIDSALAQTWQNLEVLVVDDGSTDDSREVLKRYEGRIRTILKENGGQASAFNVGIAEARGEIICFLDSDDYWFPDKVRRIVDKFKESEWCIIYHDLLEVDENSSDIGRNGFVKSSGTKWEEGFMGEKIASEGFVSTFSPTSGISLLAPIAREIVPIPEDDWRICADAPLAYAAMLHGPVGVIDCCLGAYRRHGSNGFLSRDTDPAKWKASIFINKAKRYLFLKDYVLTKRLSFKIEDVKSSYFFYRYWVMTVSDNPIRYLFRLWKKNWEYHRKIEGGGNSKWIDFTVRFLGDTVLTCLITLKYSNKYTIERTKFRMKYLTLPTKIQAYLRSD